MPAAEWADAVRAVRRRRRADPVRRARPDPGAARQPPGALALLHPLRATAARTLIEASGMPIVGTGGYRGAMVVFWPVEDGDEGPRLGRARVRARRPGPDTWRYGGNTSCVQVDARRRLDARARRGHRHPPARADACPSPDRPLHILLTHLHLDHIQGLMFFAPMFSPSREIVVWGPAAPEAPLRDRIARYLSAPLTPSRSASCRATSPSASARRRSGRSAARPSARARSPTAGRRSATASRRTARRSPTSPTTSRRSARRWTTLEDEWISGLDARPRRRPALPRRAVHRRGVPAPPRLGPLARSPDTLTLRPPRRRARSCSPSTTTRCTPTTSSTRIAADARAAAGSTSAARRTRSRSRREQTEIELSAPELRLALRLRRSSARRRRRWALGAAEAALLALDLHLAGEEVGADHEDHRDDLRADRLHRRVDAEPQAGPVGQVDVDRGDRDPARALHRARGLADHHDEHEADQHAGDDEHLLVGQLVLEREGGDGDGEHHRPGPRPAPSTHGRASPPTAAATAGTARSRSPRGRRSSGRGRTRPTACARDERDSACPRASRAACAGGGTCAIHSLQ